MDKVYVVTGSAGSYSDHHTWNEWAFASAEEAEACRAGLQAAYDREHDGYGDPTAYDVDVVPFGAAVVAGEEPHG